MPSEYINSFKTGTETAKFKSRKEASIRGILQGIAICVAIFNNYSILTKGIILVTLLLIIGIVCSSRWYQNLFKKKPKSHKEIVDEMVQAMTNNLNKNVTKEERKEIK